MKQIFNNFFIFKQNSQKNNNSKMVVVACTRLGIMPESLSNYSLY